jgi:hypothetical protein
MHGLIRCDIMYAIAHLKNIWNFLFEINKIPNKEDFRMCIRIINYQPGEIVFQPIIQLFGFDSIYHEMIIVNHQYQWPIIQGLFKVNFS